MKQRAQKDNRANFIVIIPFLLITAFFSMMFWIYPKQDKSETEFRFLAEKPVLSYENRISFPRDFEKYYNDQFPYRESFLKIFSRMQLASGKINVRDLYIANGFLLPREYLYAPKELSVSAKRTNTLMNFIRSVNKTGVYISLPYKTSVLNYLLPEYLRNNNGEQNYQHFKSLLDPDIKTCDAFRCYERLSRSSPEEYFFKTDLHWNAKGAGVAFNYILKWLSEEKLIHLPAESSLTFEYSTIEAKYLGDLNRRFSFLFPMNETIPVLKNSNKPIRYYLSYYDDKYTTDRRSITDQTLAEGTESYNSVYSSNLGYYRMTNDDPLLDTSALVIKDSMQNAMTDMFAEVFHVTEVVDIRSDVDLDQIITNSEADIVLLMYHQDNVSGDMFDFGLE